jgi:hypothetical protein
MLKQRLATGTLQRVPFVRGERDKRSLRALRTAPVAVVEVSPEPSFESVPTLQRDFPEAAVLGLAQQNPGSNVTDADLADLERDRLKVRYGGALTLHSTCAGPVRVVIVDNNGMTVHRCTTNMGVVLRQVVVPVSDRCILPVRPQQRAPHKPGPCHQRQDHECDGGAISCN